MTLPAQPTDLFSGSLERFSLLEDQHGECSQVTLWFQEREEGVSTWSVMHDVAERLEVGVLNARFATSDPDASFEAYPKLDTPRSERLISPLKVRALWKLCIAENGVSCESGLRFLLSDESDLCIVPSAFPCHLVPFRNGHAMTTQKPEYELNDYKQERIF